MDFDFGYMVGVVPQIAKYIPVTLFIAVIAMFFAVVLGFIVTMMLNARGSLSFLRYAAQTYISLFRGVPTLVQLFIIYYGMPQLFPALSIVDAITAAIIGLSFKESSYLAEVFRSGLGSIDPGQLEAGLAVGVKRRQIYTYVIFPQAARNALPAIGNIFVSLLKETSLVFTLGVAELFAEGKMLASGSLRFFETYVVVGLIYWLLVVVYSCGQRPLENWLGKPFRR